MNRTFRHVWSKAQGRWVVAAETASSRGGRSTCSAATGSASAFFALTAALAGSAAHAQIAPVGGNTEVYRAPNGVQVVNINTANPAGLSHNKYTHYNVEATGVVLNNANRQQMTRESVLAGQVMANMNLAAEAKVILNEVVSNNRSVLRGFTEVLGGKADVVLANPWGITCNGCGYINVDRAVLTTGTPQVGPGGTLDSFRVAGGDILIEGAGIDATGPRLLDLVARSVKLDGRLAGTDVGITTGANEWAWDARAASAIAGTGETPLFAFDSTVLGGMYANRIRIVATEAGVGVRMLAEAAASGDDFSLNSAGQVVIRDRLSAQRDLAIVQTQQQGASALHLDGEAASLVAGRDLTVTSAVGGLQVAAGQMVAERALSVRALSLDNTGTVQGGTSVAVAVDTTASNAATGKLLTTAQSGALSLSADQIENAGTLQSKGALSLSAVGALEQASTGRILTVSAAQGGDDGALNVSANSLINHGLVGSSGTLAVQTVAALANDGTVQSVGDLNAQAGTVLSQTANGRMVSEADVALASHVLENHGLASAGRDLSLTTVADVANDGTVQAARHAEVTAGTAVIQTAQAKLIADGDVSIDSASLENHGTVVAGSALSANASGNIANDGTLQSTGSSTLSAGSAVTQTAQAKLISGDAITLSTPSLDNAGRIQAAGALAIGDAAHRVTLSNRNGGNLRSSSVALYAGSVLNEGGARIQWDKAGLVNATSLNNAASTSVIIGSLGDGSSATYGSTYTVSGNFSNAGVVHSGGDATITAGTVTNTNTAGVSALRDLSATATQSANGSSQALRNEGAFYAARNLTLSAANGTMINQGTTGTLDAGGNIAVTARDVINQNAIRAQNITLTGTNSFVNQPPGGLPTIYLDENPVSSTGEHVIDSHEFNCNFFGSACDARILWESTVTLRQRLSSPMPATKAQILAGNTLNISWGAGGGANQAGILSAQTINLSGSGSFTNQDFHLDEITYAKRHARTEIDCTFCSADYTHYYPVNEAQFNQAPGDNGDEVTWGSAGVWSGNPGSYRQERVRTTYSTSGAGIFAVNLNYSGGTLRNYSSPQQANPTSRGATGTAGVAGSNATRATVTFAGLDLALPTNPNGLFVASKNPNAEFLVETNPLFAVGTDFVGSDYMSKRYGFNPDTTQKRLGDSAYEAQLIRQQLIAQTGRNLLVQAESESKQMQRLMDNALSAAASMGLAYGKAPTADQLASLKSDMVWMVETVVNGQKVLAPVVYLSQATRDALSGGGATIDVANADIKADSLENTGGTIKGSETLNIATKGDITNTSGNIQGGNVSLTSTEGSIVNKTLAETRGDDLMAKTNIGKTAGIQATGSLALDAKKDIKVIGANVAAGKDASLSAGGNVTVDTIVDKTTTSKGSSFDLLLFKSSSQQTVSTEKNIGSNLDIGNNLTIKSGGDTTIAGSSAKAGGDLNVDAGGSFNVLARQDSTTTKTSTSKSGLGVGGGLTGSETTTQTDFDGRNVGSTIQAGGNAKLNAAKDMVVQGSDVKIAGNADIQATEGIKILDGLDEKRSTTHTETTTYLKLGGSAAAEADAKAKNGSGRSAEASASASASSEIKLAEKSVSDSVSGSRSSVASNFSVGGNLNMKTDGTLTVQGSNVAAGGDLAADARNIEMLAGRNETYASSSTTSKSIGIYSDAEAGASAKASQTGTAASASVGAEAKSTTTIGARLESSSSDSYSLKNTASTLTSGGATRLTAKEEAKFVGADVKSGGDLSIQAKDITSLAAQDIETSSSSMKQQTAGLYVGSSASAQASADTTGGRASAGAEVSAGLRYADKASSESAGSVTQVTSNFQSGGNITRQASNTITDQGTQLEAAGNIKQNAREIKEIAADNKTYSSSSSSSNDARIGVYAGAEAGADSRTGKAGADASAGLKASYEGSTESASESSTKAVTSRYKAGGSVDSTSTEKTTLIGTRIEAGKEVNLTAGSLDYQAARDTSTSSSSSLSGAAELKVGILGTAGVNGSAELDANKASASSSTARAGGITAGSGINVKTTGDASFEGTNLKGGDGGVSVDAGGNVDFKAARSTSTSSEVALSASISAGTTSGGAGKSEKEGAASLGVSASGSSSNTAQASTIEGGAGGVTIKAGNNAKLEGTQVKSGGDTAVQAGGKVEMVAAKSSSSSYGISAGISAGGSSDGKGGGTAGGGVGIGAEGSSSSSSQAVSIQSTGKTTTGTLSAADKKKADAAKKAEAAKKAAATKAKAPASKVGNP